MPRPRRSARVLGIVGLLVATAGALPARAEEDAPSVREGLKEVGHGVRDVTRETGHAFRDAARDVKSRTRESREEVADETGGVLASLGEALDELAARIRSWSSDD